MPTVGRIAHGLKIRVRGVGQGTAHEVGTVHALLHLGLGPTVGRGRQSVGGCNERFVIVSGVGVIAFVVDVGMDAGGGVVGWQRGQRDEERKRERAW